MGDLFGKAKSKEEKMKTSLVLLLCFVVLMSLFLPAIEAAAARRRGKKGGRRGGVSLRGRQQGRRGRQDEDVAADDANAVDGEGEELHNGCDWKTNIGGFLTFCKWRKWCADEKGVTDFGPYGGVPEACPPVAEEEEAEE